MKNRNTYWTLLLCIAVLIGCGDDKGEDPTKTEEPAAPAPPAGDGGDGGATSRGAEEA